MSTYGDPPKKAKKPKPTYQIYKTLEEAQAAQAELLKQKQLAKDLTKQQKSGEKQQLKNQTPVDGLTDEQRAIRDQLNAKQDASGVPKYDWGGALNWGTTGATIGATVGSAVSPVGTVIGGAAGALIGGVAGYFADDSATEAANAEKSAGKVAMGSTYKNRSVNMTKLPTGQSVMYGPTIARNGAILYGMGGNMVPAELEKEEVVQTPQGQVDTVNLPSHEQAANIEQQTGVNPNVANYPQGSRVFSDSLKLKGKTFADHAAVIEREIKRYEKLEKKNPDAIRKRSVDMMIERANDKLDNLFQVQEIQKVSKEATTKFVDGGSILSGLGSSVSSIINSSNQMKQNENVTNQYQAAIGQMNADRQQLYNQNILPPQYAENGGTLKMATGGPIDPINLTKYSNFLQESGPYDEDWTKMDATEQYGLSKIASNNVDRATRLANQPNVYSIDGNQVSAQDYNATQKGLTGYNKLMGNQNITNTTVPTVSTPVSNPNTVNGLASGAMSPKQLNYRGNGASQSSQPTANANPKSSTWDTIGNIAGELGEISPILYNAYMGSKKPTMLNPNAYTVNKPIEALMIDSSEQQRQADRMASNLINNPNINAAERVASINNLGMTKAGIRQQTDNANAQGYMSAQQADLQRQQFNKQMEFGVTNTNMQSAANKRNFGSAMVSQLSDYSQGNQLMKNQQTRDAQLVSALANSFPDYKMDENGNWYWIGDKSMSSPVTTEQMLAKLKSGK